MRPKLNLGRSLKIFITGGRPLDASEASHLAAESSPEWRAREEKAQSKRAKRDLKEIMRSIRMASARGETSAWIMTSMLRELPRTIKLLEDMGYEVTGYNLFIQVSWLNPRSATVPPANRL